MIRGSRKEGLLWRAFRCSTETCLILLLGCSWSLVTIVAQRANSRRSQNARPPTSSGPNNLSPAARKSLDAAIAALQANSLGEAERQARAAVTAAPRSAVTYNILGVVLDRGGRKEQALTAFNAAIRIDPTFVSARNNLGRMLAENGKTAQAIAL